MNRLSIVAAAAAGLAACGQSTDNGSANQETAQAAQAKKDRPPYCFFKDSETKGWSASRDKQGNIVVHGKAYREDSRYQAQIGKTDVSGTTATLWPTVAPNMTGYGAPDNWWDVKSTIPNSSSIETVSIRCGAKTLADLKVAPAK